MSRSILFFTIAFLLSACYKENQTLVEGTYVGTFKVEYSANPSVIKTGPVTLQIIENYEFMCSSNPDRYPAGGDGQYSQGENQILFEDQGFWTADFDWNLILDGPYSFTFDGNKLKIWAEKNGVGIYSYDLLKQ